jgi:hypothetical protein
MQSFGMRSVHSAEQTLFPRARHASASAGTTRPAPGGLVPTRERECVRRIILTAVIDKREATTRENSMFAVALAPLSRRIDRWYFPGA